MKNKIQVLRESKGLTQTELSEKSGLSLRTIQRLEAGNAPKGFTLKAIAKALETKPEELLIFQETTNIDRAKLINLSVLSGLVIPFSGIILPLILTYKSKDAFNKELGKSIVSIQIILTATLSVFMIICPFIQKSFSVKFPLFLIPLILFICLKLLVVLINGNSLNQKNDLAIKLKYSFL
ncbi:helix-turn-helix domain-containing protein [Flavobacterium qiangtangense]|uniref:Helix-turn-helix domain-containing protein n=1 Tax=Flavobacterium qiangtangense TaxID=1442595 RepID=A0ABW1PJX2_9FLAO